MAGLNIRQRKFCRAYLKTKCDAREALRIAGYKETKGYGSRVQVWKIFRQPEVKEYYNGLVKKMEHASDISTEWVYEKLKKTVNACIPDDDLINPKSAATGIKALSEINKMKGNYAPAKTETTNLNVNTDAEVEDIERIFAELCKQNEKQF